MSSLSGKSFFRLSFLRANDQYSDPDSSVVDVSGRHESINEFDDDVYDVNTLIEPEVAVALPSVIFVDQFEFTPCHLVDMLPTCEQRIPEDVPVQTTSRTNISLDVHALIVSVVQRGIWSEFIIFFEAYCNAKGTICS